MNLSDKRVLVVGAGKSGLAAAAKLTREKAHVILTDKLTREKLRGLAELGLRDDQMVLGKEPHWNEVKADLIVLSPGVSPQLPFIREALNQGVTLWSEVELAMREHPAFKIGITGTNGKTTTTTLIGELAKLSQGPVLVAGNIGIPLSEQVDALDQDGVIVAELSSFQLEFIDRLRLNVGIILNITPDHLDRHGSLEDYLAAKARIFENQEPGDLAVLNWDDQAVRALGGQLKSRVLYFSPTVFLPEGISIKEQMIVYGEKGTVTPVISPRELQLRGTHNLENVMAAMAAARELGLSWEQIAEGLRRFKGVEHRQEVVGTFEGILFINDSKGTNPDAAEKALFAFAEPIVLIAGGKNKGLDFHGFMNVVKQQVKSLVLVGMAADEMEQAARDVGVKRLVRAQSFEKAVELAIAEAEAGDVVLLSPACTSWDMFQSYEERGEFFKQLVRRHYSKPNL